VPHAHVHADARAAEHARPASRLVRLLLAAVLVPSAVVVVVAALTLRVGATHVSFPAGLGPQTNLVKATVVGRHVNDCPPSTDPESGLPLPQIANAPDVSRTQCLTVRVHLTSGPHKGQTVSFDTVSTPVRPFPHSGGVLLSYDPKAIDGNYSLSDIQRGRPLTLLFVLFAALVALVARWTGVRALIGLAASGVVIVAFVLPALLAGHSALLVSLVGSAAVLFLVLYLAYGINVQTSIALLGTLLSLLLCGLLAQLFVIGSSLTGLGSDEADLLASTVTIDLRGLLLAGVVIGALGALLDMTVTQASAVWQLHQANPAAPSRQLYTSAMAIGRDHVGAATTTLVLAYAGAALPLLVLYQLAHADFQDVVTSEIVGSEVVRTLVGSIGLVASVPLTTALAVLAVRADRTDLRQPVRSTGPPSAARSWNSGSDSGPVCPGRPTAPGVSEADGERPQGELAQAGCKPASAGDPADRLPAEEQRDRDDPEGKGE